ncbi:hypothetical protein D3C72_1541970 [compost metagenome]
MVALEEHQITFGIGIVSDNRGKGEKENGNGNKGRSPTADGGGQGSLSHVDTADIGYRLIQYAGRQDDRGGRAANHDGIDKDTEHLHVALRRRVRWVRGGGSRRVGRGTHTGLVGKQATLNALGHCLRNTIADGTCRRFLQPEGALEHQRQDCRHMLDILANHPECQQ